MTDANFCSSCGAPAAVLAGPAHRPRLVRPRQPRMVAGVCSGVAIFFTWNVDLVRILLCVFTVLSSGLGLVLYLLAWVVIPEAQYALSASTQRQGNMV